MAARIARLSSALALAGALAYGLFFVFGPTGQYCRAREVLRPGESPTTGPLECGTTSFIEMQRDHLFPALGFILLWSLVPIVAIGGVRLRLAGHALGLALVGFALLVEASSIISMGGGFVYALLVAPLLLITLAATALARPFS